MKRLLRKVRGFRRGDDGSVVVEAVIVLPLMFWAYLTIFDYWDGFRAMNTIQKASYTISDMISREMEPVNSAYIRGMRDTMNYMLDPDESAKIRVTSVMWDELDDRYEVLWSNSPDGQMQPLTTATLQPLAYRLPMMADGTTVLLLQTEVRYRPPFNTGLNPMTYEYFIVTRPRFAPRVDFGT
ncbi:TadE/TadG family type IV pilus assembly protein [Paracoccaceae bacterium Fryx2]|nr:TadE/TadG family type IV pilus assembly protein [Paracoccaceae bacterium Fryx2]